MKYKNEFEFKVYGEYALFSDPITRVGGEKATLSVPTFAALIGIVKNIYWKPTLLYVVDEVKVLKPIRTVSKGVRPIKYSGGNDLSMYTYLHDVAYAVRGHFVWNENHPELAQDRNEDKHYQILQRMIKIGGRRDIYLGTRECQGYVEPCKFDEEVSFYKDSGDISFGLSYHSIIYADEAVNEEDKGQMTVCFHTPVMKNGVIKFIKPEECTIKRHIRKTEIKVFGKNKCTTAEELYEEVKDIELDECFKSNL
ncbi:MAG: type I-C CRISPR-associated protein Cas5 [Ruminococcus sp.]|nr:type I-C CRISPR-associated protein Cas5 [Ruminococcus sp.]